MKKAAKKSNDADMLDECDFSNASRNKYAPRYWQGSNVVVLAPDVAKVFPDSESVNEALRTLLKLAAPKAKSRIRV